MTEQNEAYTRLKNILKELFQLDQADLDFGIYRIMNQKRDEVTDFLENRLVTKVKDVLDEHADKDKDKLKEELESLKKTLTDAGVDVSTNEKVQRLERQVSQADTTDLQNSTFSHLTNFFKRYYKEGDFISQRRYKDDVYAIPFQGEEVKLHWANHDQYYIKTSENFKNYRFKLRNGKWVNFELLEASTEQNNNKGQNEVRKFKLADDYVYREDGDTLTIYFTYEPMSKSKKQDKLMSQAFETIKEEIPRKWLTELLQPKPTEKNKNRTLLEKHLKDYTVRNTFDYFIHKDLGKFLRRELDFYVKNEILHIDDIDLNKDESYREALQVIKAFKKVGLKIIDFLTQLEEFQKKLWLKKKFVLQSDYCITLDHIDEKLFEEIAANDKQREEWIKLYSINELDNFSEPLTTDFLKNNLFLMVDTQLYSREWKYELLATIDHLDDQISGLMINSENFQALKLLEVKYANKIKLFYNDPPYNTERDREEGKFLYKDNYAKSSWVTFIENRIELEKSLRNSEYAHYVSIDESELDDLVQLIRTHNEKYHGIFTWRRTRTGGHLSNTFNQLSDYVIVSTSEFEKKLYGGKADPEESQPLTKKANSKSRLTIPKGKVFFKNLENGVITQDDIKESANVELIQDCKIEDNFNTEPLKLQGNFIWSQEYLKSEVEKGATFIIKKYDTLSIRFIRDPEGHKPMPSLSDEHFKVGTNEDGSSTLYKIFGREGLASYPKPVDLIKKLIQTKLEFDSNLICLDYFAGSGTTGQAMIELNRNSARGKYIMVEMGQYFNSVMKPRIQKVVYSKDWESGNPVDREGISHMFQYLCLESYEDTLNNLSLSRSEQQQRLLANEDLKEEYILNYMLDVEAKESLLNTEMFKQPFGYSIEATDHNERVPTEVDLVETFNYLIGLHIVSIQMIKGYVVVTGHNNDGEHILVIWREIEKHSNEDLEKFVNTMEFNPLDGEFDTIYVNGDNNLQNLRKEEDTWKVRLIEEEFHKRMFETEGL